MATNIDTEFVRFRNTRDPEALAAVFDATAPRLLLVAMHLCRDAATAEDLVQTVFLQAIRDAEQFDPSRKVLPWLLGILEHRAHDRRERAHVRKERGSTSLASAGSALADPTPGPRSAAEDAELRAQVAAALESVPKNYREVLTLRLVHGLRAVDIAHAQGVSPETVRTKLRRGLAMLRSSLPRGVATASLLTLLATECLRASDGLPAVRRTVLQAIATPTAAVAGTFAIKWLWGIAIAAALVIGAMLTIRPPEPTPPAGTVHPMPPAAATSASGETNGASDAAATRTALTQGQPQDSTPESTTTLRGRVVSKDHGGAIADATVSFRTYSSAQRGGVPGHWVDPQPVTTDRDGVFRFSFVPPPELFFEFCASAPGHVPEWTGFESLRQGIDVDVGTLELEPGTPVRLRVLVDGEPCPQLEVYAGRSENGGSPSGMRGKPDTDLDGQCDFGMCGAGTWHYRIDSYLAGPVAGSFDVPLQAHALTHTVELTMPRPELSVRGTVVDQYARPVGGLTLELPSQDGYGYTTATTNERGAFVFSKRQTPDGNPDWRLRLPAERTDLEWLQDGGSFPWGTNDLQLVVRRRTAGSLRLEVVDAATGEPVENYGARCLPDPWQRVGSSPHFGRVDATRHEDGEQVFSDLRPAPYRVSVFPEPPYARQTWLRTTIEEGRTTLLKVALSPPADLAVTVVTKGTGERMHDVDVALCRVVPEDRFDRVAIGKYRTAFERRGTAWFGTGTNVVVVDHARTDADGNAILRMAANTPATALFVRSPRCQDLLVPLAELPQAGAEVRIEVEAAATLRGVLAPREFVTRFGPAPEAIESLEQKAKFELLRGDELADDYPEIELRRPGAGDAIAAVYVDRDGNFSFASLPPDTYELWAKCQIRSGPRSSSSRSFGPLLRVDLATDGKPAFVTVDASDLVPAQATGRYYVDGKPWSGEAGVARLGETAMRNVLMTDTQGDSRVSPWLVPGRYHPFARVEIRPDVERTIYGLEPLTLTPGQQLDFKAVLQRRRVTVTLLDAQGNPLADRRVVPQSPDHPQMAYEWRYGARTDDHGRCVFDPAPPGRLRIMAFDPSQELGRSYVAPAIELGTMSATATGITVKWPR